MTSPPANIVQLAIFASTRSPCRSQRGAVVFRGGYAQSSGFNHKPPGFVCDQSDACKATCRIEAIHAEQSALLHAGVFAIGSDLLHVKTVHGQLVFSGRPSCVECSKLALETGIAGVWLYHAEGWRRYDTVDFHRRSLIGARS